MSKEQFEQRKEDQREVQPSGEIGDDGSHGPISSVDVSNNRIN